MNDVPVQKLRDIIDQHGAPALADPTLCEAYLRDLCGQHKLEINLLVLAHRAGTPEELQRASDPARAALAVPRLEERLRDEFGLSADRASWVVSSWAVVLGLGASASPGQSASPTSLANTGDYLITRVGQIRMRKIPAGEFWMGSADSDTEAHADEKPRHKVRISQDFLLGVMPMTQAQYQTVMGNNPSHFPGQDDRPVEMVSWWEAVVFCNTLSRKHGLAEYYDTKYGYANARGGAGYRLPTEAEWEYAARGGATTRYCFGDDPSRLGEYAWFAANSGDEPWPVGQRLPNAFGLYDMHGNVWEWCFDAYREIFYQASASTDPTNADQLRGVERVIRGGAWSVGPSDVRAASRARECGISRSGEVGFRVARGLSGR